MTAEDVAIAAQLACLLEASADKPGNVSPNRSFANLDHSDFLAAASAIGPAFLRVGERPLGATIRSAVEATARWTTSNTNLGIVLLLAPLARAARDLGGSSLRPAVERVLASTTVADAVDAFAAIRLARPGGLGQADEQDVATEPTVTLREAMRLAAERDGVAREYATAFEMTFVVGAPALTEARGTGLAWSDAVLHCYLTLLAGAPDTLIARKLGTDAAIEVSRAAAQILSQGGVRTERGRAGIAALDTELRAGTAGARNARNPGTTADLTAAAIFVALLAESPR